MFRRRTSSSGNIHYRININKNMCLGVVDIYIDGKLSCTVSKNRAGQYLVSVLVETEQCYKQKTSKTVGVDLGIKTLATLSDLSDFPRSSNDFTSSHTIRSLLRIRSCATLPPTLQ